MLNACSRQQTAHLPISKAASESTSGEPAHEQFSERRNEDVPDGGLEKWEVRADFDSALR
jgi:hypothetical protein